MSTLKRETPPPVVSNKKSTDWSAVFADIRTTPWEWVNTGEYPAAYVTGVKTGRFAGAEAGEFEATMRNTDPVTQKGTLYIRYIANGDTEAEWAAKQEIEALAAGDPE